MSFSWKELLEGPDGIEASALETLSNLAEGIKPTGFIVGVGPTHQLSLQCHHPSLIGS